MVGVETSERGVYWDEARSLRWDLVKPYCTCNHNQNARCDDSASDIEWGF